MLGFAIVLVGACGDLSTGYTSYTCYEGETCSHDTPSGLVFRGMDVEGRMDARPGPVAVGGTQAVTLLDPSDDYEHPRKFGRRYATDTSMPAEGRDTSGVEVVNQDGSVVTVRGVAESYTYLRILADNGDLYGRTVLASAPIHHRQLRPPYEYDGPDENEAVVWAIGEHDVTVGLWSAEDPTYRSSAQLLVDESMLLTAPDATQTRWDTIHLATTAAGHRNLTVTAGSGSVVLDLETVAMPDAIEGKFTASETLSIYGSKRLCFGARHASRWVAGATWSFAMEGGQVLDAAEPDSARTGCTYFAANVQGPVHLRVTASGYTQTIDVMAH